MVAVSWCRDVGLSRNERNPIASYLKEDSGETAVDKTEEGGDDVKSSCPLYDLDYTYYNGV